MKTRQRGGALGITACLALTAACAGDEPDGSEVTLDAGSGGDPAVATSRGGSSASGGASGQGSADGGSTGDVAPDASLPESPLTGEMLYWMPIEGGNTFACATCHSLEEPGDGIRRAGHSIGDATKRPSYKNGQLDEMLDAVNSCLREWMFVREPWTETSRKWQLLRQFLSDQSFGGPAEPISFEIVAPPPAGVELEGGDPDAGRQLFNTSCAECHGMDASGTLRGPQLNPALLNADYIALRVRTSGAEDSDVYSGLTGGRMPFWAADRLSEDELRDLVAFVLQNDPPPPMLPPASGGSGSTGGSQSTGGAGSGGMVTEGGTPAAGGASGGTATGGSGAVGGNSGSGGAAAQCPSTHAKVGQVAEIVTKYHMVAGTATIVDDCTIELTHFTYDGGGIDARIVAGTMGNYSPTQGGFSLSGNLVGMPAMDVTRVLKLPEGKTLDDVDAISVWCIPAAVDFGSGLFAVP